MSRSHFREKRLKAGKLEQQPQNNNFTEVAAPLAREGLKIN